MARLGRPRPGTLAAALALTLLLAVPAAAEVVQKNGLIVSFGGSISPHTLPRTRIAPISVTVDGRVRTSDRRVPPSLRRISLEINRNGVLDDSGLPSCRAAWIQPASSSGALAKCGRARVGGGQMTGLIVLPEQRPFPFRGRVIAFNARGRNGEPAILAHLYSNSPFALAVILTFSVRRIPGTYGTRLVAVVPARTRQLVHITSFELRLGRRFERGGKQHSYLSAACPAPAGFPGATFPLARSSYSFVGGTTLRSVIVRTCHARP